jgi:cyclophilin family peptidyl-prolyl cis-trans isomerase
MRIRIPAIFLAATAAAAGCSLASATEVAICTDNGRIVVELNEQSAPLQVENFLSYVDSGHYTGTVFHRVIEDFMIQGGGVTRGFTERPATRTVQNESRNGAANVRGTIAAARTGDPHSAAAQFFINTADNSFLDARGNNWGYTVFGAVTDGMEVVDEIAALPTGGAGPFPSDVPTPLVTILSVSVLDREVLSDIDGPDLQAAMLARIDAAEETGDSAQALRWLSHYRASCGPAGPDLLVTEARHSIATDAPTRARYALEEFFATAAATHRDYTEAETLFTQLMPASTSFDIDSFGECLAPDTPVIPDGARESLDGMLAGQQGVRAFMGASDDYLECLDDYIDDQDDESALRAAAIAEYNRMVDVTQQVGDDFNREVRAFRERE